jgi:hypothetical protein
MTKEEMILFGKAISLLRKAKFHYHAQNDERDIVVENIQQLLCIHGLDILADMHKSDEKTS